MRTVLFFWFLSDCTEICTADYNPVCGSDDQTYPNKCKLEVAACNISTTNLTVSHEGECTGKENLLLKFASVAVHTLVKYIVVLLKFHSNNAVCKPIF